MSGMHCICTLPRMGSRDALTHTEVSTNCLRPKLHLLIFGEVLTATRLVSGTNSAAFLRGSAPPKTVKTLLFGATDASYTCIRLEDDRSPSRMMEKKKEERNVGLQV